MAAAAALLMPFGLLAADRYYVGPDNGLWNDTANWSTTSGGAGGASVPGEGDRALITHSDGTTRTVTYDYAGPPVTLQQVSVNNSGAGTTTFLQSANLLNTGSFIVGDAGSGYWALSGGTLNITGTGSSAVLNFGNNSTGTGVGTLSGGTLLVQGSGATVNVGLAGSGTFTHSGGTASLYGLEIGRAGGSSGLYRLNGSGILTASQFTTVGDFGAGTFDQNGGSFTTNTIYLGGTASGTGTFLLSGGQLHATAGSIGEIVGQIGTGFFHQTNGSNTVDDSLIIANSASATGTYKLDDGTLSVGNTLYLGYSGNGTFIQSGGTHTVGAFQAGVFGNGTYLLSGGTLIATYESIGQQGSGTFVQTGGTNTTGQLNLGNSASGAGTYLLSGGTLTTNGFAYIGTNGDGHVIQTGGIHTVVGTNVKIADSAGSTGIYNLSAGEFAATTAGEFVGLGGAGTFIQSGGTHTVQSAGASFLTIGALTTGVGNYLMSGGTLNSNAHLTVGDSGLGTFNQSGGLNTVGTAAVQRELTIGNSLGGSGTYLLSATSTLNVNGNVVVGSSGNGRFIQSGGVHTVGTNLAPGNLYLGATSTGVGTYALNNSSAELHVNGNVHLGGVGGPQGTGVLQISAGDVEITGTLKIWNTPNTAVNLSGGTLSVGTLNMDLNPTPTRFNWTGGTLAITASGFDIGPGNALGSSLAIDSSKHFAVTSQLGVVGGGVITQTGGSVRGGNVLVGRSSLSAGTYIMSAGQLNSLSTEHIGSSGYGTFIQSGGSHTVGSPTSGTLFYLGANSNTATGYYALSGTGLLHNYVAEYIGGFGSGTFDQSGGTHIVDASTNGGDGILVLGDSSTGNGTYALSGGTLTVQREVWVGNQGAGTFAQNGGSHTIGVGSAGRLSIGRNSGAGTYNLNGSSAQLQLNGNGYVGGSESTAGGTGVLNISDGTATVSSTLKVWNTPNTAVNLSGGTLSVGSLDMNSNPTPARFNWTGGRFNITNSNVAIDYTGPLGNTVNLGSSMTLGISQTLNVNSGGTLAGNGNVIGNVAVNSGGHVAPGASVGQLTLTNLTLNTGAILDYELAAPTSGDRINVTASGGLTLAGMTTLNLANLGGLGVGSYILFDYNTSFGGSLSNLSLGTQPGGFNYLIQNNPGNTSIDLLVSSLAAPADRYFVAGDQTVFANAANWSATPNGPGGAGIPVNGDSAYLTNNLPGGRSVALGPHAFTGAGLAKLVIDGQTAEEQFLHTDSAGAMIAGEVDVGLSGIGRFNHFAGSNKVTGTMFVGKNPGSQGNYDLTNTATMSFSAITFEGPLLIGYFGTGDLLMKEQAEIKVDGGNVGVGVRNGGIGFVRHDGGLFRMTNVGGSPSMFIGRADGSNGTYTMTQTAGASTLSIDGNLYAGYQGNGTFIQNAGVVKLNNGYLFVANEATSDGAYIMNGGSLSASEIVVGGFAGGAGGNGSFTFNGGSVSVGQAIRVWQTGAATLSAGTVNVTQDTSIYGKFTVTGGVLNTPGNASGLGLNVQSGATLSVSGGTVNIGDLYNYGTINKTGGAINIAGFISGDGFYNQYGGSTFFRTGAAVNTQDVALLGGEATAEADLLVGSDPISPGILNISGGSLTIPGLLGIGNTGVINAGVGIGDVNVSGGSLTSGSMILGSTAGGDGSLTLTGTGYVSVNGTVKVTTNGNISLANTATLVADTLDLSGSASGFDWTGGTLRINTSAPGADGALTVPNGGVLGGLGTIERPTTVNAGGSIAPGNSAGIMTFATHLTLTESSSLVMEIGAPTAGTGYDQIIMTSGGVLTAGGAQLKLIAMPGIVTGVTYTIIDATGGSVSGTFKYLTTDLLEPGPYSEPGVEFSISYTGNLVQVTFSAVPEPSGLLPIIGVGMLLSRRRRRDGR